MNKFLLFTGNKKNAKEVSAFLTAVAKQLRENKGDYTQSELRDYFDYLISLMDEYFTMKARVVAEFIKSKDDTQIIKNFMALRFVKELEKYNDPEKLSDRPEMSFDTFFNAYIKRAAVREYFLEKRGFKQYQVDRIMHITHVVEYLVSTYGMDEKAITVHDIFMHQEESGRETHLTENVIEKSLDLMKEPESLSTDDSSGEGYIDVGLLRVEKEETARELIEFMQALGDLEKMVFVLRFPDEDQLSYKAIGRRPDVIDRCMNCDYRRYVTADGYVDDGFLEGKYRGVVRRLRRFIADNNLSTTDLLHCIGLVIDAERDRI